MSKTVYSQRAQLIVGLIVVIIVAVIGSAGFWQYMQTIGDRNNVCDRLVSDISIANAVIPSNETVVASVQVANPEGLPLTLNWRATYGQMEPAQQTTSTQSLYTPPSNITSTDDTISVDVNVQNCSTIKRSILVRIIPALTPTTAPTSAPTLTPTAPAAHVFRKPEKNMPLITFTWNPQPTTPNHKHGRVDLYFCIETRRYWVKSDELQPNPHGLIDRQDTLKDPCKVLYPAVDIHPQDVVQIAIGAPQGEPGTPVEMQVFEVRRTADGNDIDVREVDSQTLPLPTPVP